MIEIFFLQLRFSKRAPDSIDPLDDKKQPATIEEEVFIDTRLQQVEDENTVAAEHSNSKNTEEHVSESSQGPVVVENVTLQNDSTASIKSESKKEPEVSEATFQTVCQSDVENIEDDEIVKHDDVSQTEESIVKEHSPVATNPGTIFVPRYLYTVTYFCRRSYLERRYTSPFFYGLEQMPMLYNTIDNLNVCIFFLTSVGLMAHW